MDSLLSRKLGNSPSVTNRTYLAVLVWSAAFVFLLAGCLPASEKSDNGSAVSPVPVEANKPKPALVEPNIVGSTGSPQAEIPKSRLTAPDVVKTVSGLIYQGGFDSAGELIQRQLDTGQSSIGTEEAGRTVQEQAAPLARLAGIVQEYKAINQRRKSAQQAAYKEHLDELEKFRRAAEVNVPGDINDVNGAKAISRRHLSTQQATYKEHLDELEMYYTAEVNVPKDINDVNETKDVNNITSVLSAVVRANEFADAKQKNALLSEPFVMRTIQRAKTKAAEFESRGKWLDAYATCYSWLQVLDPNNEAYSDYSDQLLDKAGIAASFQDSPCETSHERYEGVDKKTFIRAINALYYNYVNVLDYRQMATKAVKRCQLLAEVMGSPNLKKDTKYQIKSAQLSAFSAGLAAFLTFCPFLIRIA